MLVSTLDQHDLFFVINFFQFDFDYFARSRGHIAPDERGLDGQFAVTTIDQHQQLHATRTPMVEERIHRGADGATGVQHVVYEDDVATCNIKADFAGVYDGPYIMRGEIVAIETYIEHAHGHGSSFDAADQRGQPRCQRHPSTLDADQADMLTAIVFLGDLVISVVTSNWSATHRIDSMLGSFLLELRCLIHAY